jgi:hypothetical protein
MSGVPPTDSRLTLRARALTISLVVATIAALAIASPALAKMPYFTVELETAAPVQGEPITLTVRLFADPQHTIPTDWPDRALSGLFAIMPADAMAGEARSLPVRLKKIGPGTYVGPVVIDRPGRWVLRAFPDRSGWGTSELPRGYPSDTLVEVRSSAPDLVLVVLMLGAILTAAGGLFVVGRRSVVAGRQSARRTPWLRPAG